MKAILAAAMLLTLAAPAYADEACLRMNDMWSWKALNSSTLIIETRWHNKFKLELQGVCPAITQDKISLLLRSHANSELACLTRMDDVFVHGDGGPQHCLIQKVEVYTPEMQKADDASKSQPR